MGGEGFSWCLSASRAGAALSYLHSLVNELEKLALKSEITVNKLWRWELGYPGKPQLP